MIIVKGRNVSQVGEGKIMRVKIKLNGGSMGGKWIDYTTPLPKTIVLTEITKHKQFIYEDYERVGETEVYEFKRKSRDRGEIQS